ncbi:MAG: hypothetical protein N2Z63_10575 [Thiobacillaceae bacterium]|nr:hypothetical protein [Thiobacillaceae bacterium]
MNTTAHALLLLAGLNALPERPLPPPAAPAPPAVHQRPAQTQVAARKGRAAAERPAPDRLDLRLEERINLARAGVYEAP